MSDIENLLKLIDCLNLDELKLLKDKIDREVHRQCAYIPSGDSEVIASYVRNFHYSEERREEVLKKLQKEIK